MATEIERKFLVHKELFMQFLQTNHGEVRKIEVEQGYIMEDGSKNLRVRRTDRGCFLTLKGKISDMSRLEYEFEVSEEIASELLRTMVARPPIKKVRYLIPAGRFTWEVDIFSGENEGLLLAEIELSDEADTFPQPEWLGIEVTSDSRYLNASLNLRPYKSWQENGNKR